MKKVILSLCVALVLVLSSGSIFAKGTRKGGQGKQTSKVEEKTKGKGKDKVAERDAARAKGKDKIKEKVEQKSTAEKNKKEDKGKGHKQQLEAIQMQFTHEEAKHLKRKVRLERIRALAFAEGNAKVVERVDKLLAKEQGRYERKQERMQKRQQTMLQLRKQELGKGASKTGGENIKERKRQRGRTRRSRAKQQR